MDTQVSMFSTKGVMMYDTAWENNFGIFYKLCIYYPLLYSGARLLGRLPTSARLRQHDGAGHQEGLQDEPIQQEDERPEVSQPW